jgi:hypothetical protein
VTRAATDGCASPKDVLKALQVAPITNLPVHPGTAGNPGIELPLRRYGRKGSTPARKGTVLLVHGASANSNTFLLPGGGLMQFLKDQEWDVWTLDWRGSRDVIEGLSKTPGFVDGSFPAECVQFTIDKVAEEDFPQALDFIQKKLQSEAPQEGGRPGVQPISVVAHCFGSGAFSVALARGLVEGFGVENVVLSTMGLFYEVPWNGWVKVEDFLIERILGADPQVRAIDPREHLPGWPGWPADLASAYDLWPLKWLPDAGPTHADDTFNRLSFMFGRPYSPGLLARGIHGPVLDDLFGGMHLGLYLHAGQMVRRGYAARLNALDVIDRSRLKGRVGRPGVAMGDLEPAHFRNKQITLIGGAQNELWHRDSIDLMYEWLLSNGPRGRYAKHMYPNHAHQDLLWGGDPEDRTEIYGTIEKAL